MTSKTKEQFLEFYPELLQQLKSSPVLQELPDMQKWIEKVYFKFQARKRIPDIIYFTSFFPLNQIVDYNVQGGKMNRGVAVLECYISFTQKKQSDDVDLKVAIALGWALEMVCLQFNL